MTDADRLTNFLFRAYGKSYCDVCLAKELGISEEQAQGITSILAEEDWSRQHEGECAGCGSFKLVIRRRISSYAC